MYLAVQLELYVSRSRGSVFYEYLREVTMTWNILSSMSTGITLVDMGVSGWFEMSRILWKLVTLVLPKRGVLALELRDQIRCKKPIDLPEERMKLCNDLYINSGNGEVMFSWMVSTKGCIFVRSWVRSSRVMHNREIKKFCPHPFQLMWLSFSNLKATLKAAPWSISRRLL